MAAMADPALLADAKKANLDLEAMSGADLQTLVAELYALPTSIVEQAKQSMIYKPATMLMARRAGVTAMRTSDADSRLRRALQIRDAATRCIARSRRMRSSSSTAARRSTSISARGAGGGYDAYARALGRHMGKYIPGNPTIVPQNMPGAGGNKAAGYVYSVAPKDGTAIGALFPGGILAPLLGDTPIQHDPAKFIFVGSANSDVYTCVAHVDSPIKRSRTCSRRR